MNPSNVNTDTGYIGMKRHTHLLSAALMLFGSNAFAASTGTLPWDTSIATLSASITGPWAYGVAIIALATAFGTLAFNNDLSGAGKTLVFLTIAIAGLVVWFAPQSWDWSRKMNGAKVLLIVIMVNQSMIPIL